MTDPEVAALERQYRKAMEPHTTHADSYDDECPTCLAQLRCEANPWVEGLALCAAWRAQEAEIVAQADATMATFMRLSDALTGGNASTWDHIFDAADKQQAEIASLTARVQELEETVDWR